MQETNKSSFVSLFAIAVLMFYLIVNQGGYFAGGIISAGIIVSLMFFFTRPRLKTFDRVFLGFSAWYLFCSLRTGFDVRYIAKGLLPVLCLMFRFLIPDDREQAQELCRKVLKISFYITIAAILLCARKSINAGTLKRLTFPFQYANGCGIFFGVMFILARHSGYEWARKRQFIFLAGLAFTQSVGAIGITVLAEIFLSRNIKEALIIFAALIIGALLLRGRVYQSVGTFIERFLQMRDGFVCMLQNPVFGIGAGRWEVHKNLYQSGFYSAKEIHSSIFQIGADSGIIGIGLFIVSGAAAFRSIKANSRVYPVAMIMILGHSVLDFSLTFAALGFFLMLLLACCESSEQKSVGMKKPAVYSLAAVSAIVFIALGTGMYQIKKLDGIYLGKNYSSYINYYETNLLSQKSRKTTEDYAKTLYATGKKQKCLEVIENMDVLSSDMIILKKGCTNDWKEVVNYIEDQPYNSVLYKTVYYNSKDETLQTKTEEMVDDALASMSFFGKILFKFKGEKVL